MTSVTAWFLVIISSTSFTYSPAFPTEKACKDFADHFNNPMAVRMACLKAEVLAPVVPTAVVVPAAKDAPVVVQKLSNSK